MSGLLAPPDARRPVGAIAGLSVVTLGCWVCLVAVSAAMGTTGLALAMPMTSAWSRADFMLMWTMWAVMMAAMMLPAILPVVRLYAHAAARAPLRRLPRPARSLGATRAHTAPGGVDLVHMRRRRPAR